MLRQLTLLRGVLTMALLFVFMAAAQPALAQGQQTWLPDYSPDRHVYVDPLLSNNRQAPVNLSGLEPSLINEGLRHGLKIYVVATEGGSDLADSDVPGRDALDKLILKWQARPGFPSDNYLIVMWVRRADNPNRGSVAANGGNWFSDWNMTGSYFSDPNGGPVIPNLRRFMPQDPAGAFLAIAQTVNAEIDAIKERQAREEAQKAFDAVKPYYFGGGIALVLILGTLIFLIVRNSSRKKKAAAKIARWSTDMDSTNELYMKLRTGYMGFLTEQSDWKTKFKNRTLAAYTAACKDFAAFSARRKRANELLAEARKALESNRFPSVKGFDEIDQLLELRTVTITGDDLPLEEAKLFGGLVEKTDYKPGGLLEAMSALFDKTNKALASIVKAFNGAKQNEIDVENLDRKITGQRQHVADNDLTMEPYEPTIAELKRGQAAFIAILSSDPLEAFAGSEAVEAGFTALSERLKRAISIKQSLHPVKPQIDGSETKAGNQRKEGANYLYPLGDGESEPKQAQAARFLLNEEGSNPDAFIADARRQLKSAHDLVFAAKLDESVTARDEAIRLAGYTSNLVDDIIAAKAFVEGHVPPVRTSLGSLTSELPAADAAVEELNSDFLAANVGKQPDKVTSAHAVKDATPGRLAQIKSLYDSQRFIAARALVCSSQGAINSSRTELTEVHAHLKELRRLRQDSRDTVATCLTTATRLAAKLRENSFTTSEATDKAFAEASRKLDLQKVEADKAIADWPAVNRAVHEVVASFQGFDSAIDAQRQAHAQARADVRDLGSAIDVAAPYVGKEVTTDATRQKLAEANSAHGTLKRRLATAKEDWKNISTGAEAARGKANEAKSDAETEIKLCGEANAAYASAQTKIAEVDRRTYGWNVNANLSTANERLRESASTFRLKQYKTARDKAKAAFKAAEEADQAAEALARKRKKDADDAAAAAAAALAESLKPKNTGGGSINLGGGGGSRRSGGGGSPPSNTGGGRVGSNTGGGAYKGRSGGGNY